MREELALGDNQDSRRWRPADNCGQMDGATEIMLRVLSCLATGCILRRARRDASRPHLRPQLTITIVGDDKSRVLRKAIRRHCRFFLIAEAEGRRIQGSSISTSHWLTKNAIGSGYWSCASFFHCV